MWYPKIAPGDVVKEGEQIGTVGDLFGEILENYFACERRCPVFDHQSFRAREWIIDGHRCSLTSDNQAPPETRRGRR